MYKELGAGNRLVQLLKYDMNLKNPNFLHFILMNYHQLCFSGLKLRLDMSFF